MNIPLFLTIPHSGEAIPPEADWLFEFPEPIQMCDVDRYVDKLYAEALKQLSLPHLIAETHRYVVDLNRVPDDVDLASVARAPNPLGTHPTGFHWSVTTQGDILMKKPISLQLHQELTRKYWEPFHLSIREMYEKFGASPNRRVFQIDAHSMPSVGTDKHRDPGERRAQVVVSDQNGISCDRDFRDLVVSSYERAGFEVKLNWPYLGGRLTQTYGKPEIGQNCIQVELNRDLYMNEVSKKLKPEAFREISVKLVNALTFIKEGLSQF